LGYRKFVGNIFNFIIRNMVGLRISDTQCGFKLYPKEAAKQLFAKLQTMGWAHDVELLKRANLLGYAIIEMPITWNAIEGSKINVLSDSWNMFWEVVKIRGMKTH
jgi:dolichyl-phosphate beta-glucosyltransferase